MENSFWFLLGFLKRCQRQGWNLIGDIKDSIASHSFRVAFLVYWLSIKEGLNEDSAIKLSFYSLFHDLEEALIGDIPAINYLRYNLKINREKITEDLERFMNNIMKKAYENYKKLMNNKKYKEILKTADTIEMLITLKEEYDNGRVSEDAFKKWWDCAYSRIKLKSGRDLLKRILNESSNNWWYFLYKELS